MPNISDFTAIPTGWKYSAHYAEVDTASGRRTIRGPSYWWNSDSTLSERTYNRIAWSYDRKGRIHHWSGPQQDEWFDAEGRWMAGYIDREFYWRGDEVSSRDFKKHLLDYWKESGIYRDPD